MNLNKHGSVDQRVDLLPNHPKLLAKRNLWLMGRNKAIHVLLIGEEVSSVAESRCGFLTDAVEGRKWDNRGMSVRTFFPSWTVFASCFARVGSL